MGSSSSTDRVLVGRIGRAHGLRGFVVVHSESDNPDRFRRGARMSTNEGAELEVVETSPAENDVLLVRFGDVDDRTAAENLRGTRLWIGAGSRRPLEPDEFWPDELIGLTVVDGTGRVLGRVRSVIEGSAQDRLEVSGDDGVFEVPFVADLVHSVDLESGRIVVEAIEGLTGSP